MERLTAERSWEEAENDLWNECGYSDIWKRLNEIENILGKEYDIDRLREVVEADREGRCVVLPVKPGGTVEHIADARPVRVDCISIYADGRMTLGFHDVGIRTRWVDEWSEDSADDYVAYEESEED